MEKHAILFFAAFFLCSSFNAQIIHETDTPFKVTPVDNPTSYTIGSEEMQVSEVKAYNRIIEANCPENRVSVGRGVQADSISEWRKGLRFGIAAGPNISYFPPFSSSSGGLFSSSDNDKDAESSQQLGFHVHGIIGYALTENIELEMRLGVLYSRFYGVRYKKSTSSSTFWGFTGRSSYREYDTLSQQSTWLEIPLILRIRPFTGKKFFMEFGAITGLLQKLEGSYSSSIEYITPPGPSIFDDSGELDGGLQAGIYLGAGFLFLKQHQVSLSWSGLQIKSYGDGTVYSDRKLPIRIWRLTFDRYF